MTFGEGLAAMKVSLKYDGKNAKILIILIISPLRMTAPSGQSYHTCWGTETTFLLTFSKCHQLQATLWIKGTLNLSWSKPLAWRMFRPTLFHSKSTLQRPMTLQWCLFQTLAGMASWWRPLRTDKTCPTLHTWQTSSGGLMRSRYD